MPTRSSIFTRLLMLLAMIGLLVVSSVALVLILARPHHPKITSPSATAMSLRTSALPVIPPQTLIFHKLQGHLSETHVPFHLYHGVMIEVDAAINGKHMNCIVDTGCPALLWKTYHHLTSNRTGLKLSIGDAGNHTANVEEAVLDRVQIGGLELDHVLSYAIAEDRTNDQRDLPILGNSMFTSVALTIDYAKQELVIRCLKSASVWSAGYRHAVSFQWVNPDARGRYGVPCIRGTVMSLPVNSAVDTGWGESSLALTRNFYSRLLPQLHTRYARQRQETIGTALGMTNAIVTDPISLYFGNVTVKSRAVVVDTLNQGAQATLGYQFLEHFTTTIDYPQKKIWFEPIQASLVKTSSR